MRLFDVLSQWELIPKAAENPIIFDASEIASELDRIERQSGASYPRETYGVCAPPFRDRYFWIEAVTKPNPDNYQSPGYLEDIQSLGIDPEELLQNAERMRDHFVARGALCIARDWEDSELGRTYRGVGESYDSGRWIIEVKGFTAVYKDQIRKRDILRYPGRAFIVIGRDGTLLSDPENTIIESYGEKAEYAQIAAWGLANMLPFVLLALSFLHRRTEVDYITPNRLERKTAARRMGQKSGAAPLRDYYLLRIKPHIERDNPLTDPSQIRQLGTRGGDKRAHSVRGHFRRVPDSGLFGRGYNAGELIWIPDHLRGETALGDIQKGYKISK